MVSTSIKNVLFAAMLAVVLIGFGANTTYAHEHGDNNDNDGQTLSQMCHNGIDDDHDGFIDLLDSDCAEFRPVCDAGFHSNEVFECVPDEQGDPTCVAPQVLLNNVCVDPQPIECVSPQVPNDTQTACVDPTPVVPVCVGGQTLVLNQCVDPTCTDTQTLNTDTHLCVDNEVTPTVTPPVTPPPANDGNGGGNGGGGNGPIAGSLGNGGSIVPGGSNGPVSGSLGGGEVLGASCSPLISSYMGVGKHNNPEDVKALQAFLNKELSLSLDVNGIFDAATEKAVEAFQLKYDLDVLAPWTHFGLAPHSATGYVYKTTLRKINLLNCSSLQIPMPILP